MEPHQWIFSILAALLILLAGFILSLAGPHPYNWSTHAKFFGAAAAAAALSAVFGVLASNQGTRDSESSSDDRTTAQEVSCIRTEKALFGMVTALEKVREQVKTSGDGDTSKPVSILAGYRGSVAHERHAAEELNEAMAGYTATGLTLPSDDDPALMIEDLSGMLTRLPSEIAEKKNYGSDWGGLRDRKAHFSELAKSLSAKCSMLSAT